MKKSTTTTTTTNTNTTTDISHPRPPSFEIRVALVGYVSVGKSTVLNALLGDKFSEVSLRRTTAGINFFRIYQNNKDHNKKTSTSTKDTIACINDDDEKTTTNNTTTANTTEAEEKEQDLEKKSSSSSSSVGEEWSIVVDNNDDENNNKTFKSSVETHNEIEQDNKLLRDAAVVAAAVDVDVCDSSPSQSGPNDGTTTTTGGGNDGNGDDGDVKNDTKDEEEEKEQKQQVGEGGGVSEKVFHVQVDHHPIIGGNEKGKNNNNDGGMRDDTRLVLIDIPGINEAGSSSDSINNNNNNNNNNKNKYKDYVESNWDTFDCVICVLDAIQGVNTQEQIELLKFIKRNNDNLKKIPTIILGNKMDDLNDDDTQNLIEETRLKTIEIFGNDCYDCTQFKEEEEEEEEEDDNDNDNDALPSRSSAVFIPLSAKNAFMYRKAGNINLNELEDIKYRDVVNKIGYDEYGRKWSKMSIQQQIESVIEILSDPDEYNMRLAGTNFHTFLNVLTYYAGGNEAQKYLLSKQIDIELSRIANGSNKKSISESIYKVYERCKAIDRTDGTTNNLKDTFWNAFQDCERKVFLGDLNKTSSTNNNVVNSTSFERLFFELEKYNELSTLLGWTEESSKAIGTMKRLLRRQISFLLEKIEKWNFDSFCGEVSPTINTVKNHCTGTYGYCAHTSSRGHSCNQSFNKAHAEYSSLQFKCGVSRTVFESKWKVPENVTWENLSPHDWITILSSLSLVWNQSRFIEDFGMEKVKLEELLSMFRMVFTSIFGLSIDGGEAMVGSSTYYVQAYKDAIKQYGKDDAIMKVMMPHTLTDPSHWGYFAWKYIKLCDGKNLVGPVSEFGENADAKPVELASSDISKDVDVKPMEE